jgi:hypothetical protein
MRQGSSMRGFLSDFQFDNPVAADDLLRAIRALIDASLQSVVDIRRALCPEGWPSIPPERLLYALCSEGRALDV